MVDNELLGTHRQELRRGTVVLACLLALRAPEYGYALLKLFERTGDEAWLARARAFAMHAAEQVERQRAAHGQGRYALWTGDVGVALYLASCLAGTAEVPTLDRL